MNFQGARACGALVVTLVLVIPRVMVAQTNGGIAGTVRDTTRAVLPGVTIEAASPALIEKVRSAVTDDQGNYKIVDLRPGIYTVTFTLAGFSTVRRTGIEVSAGITSNVTAELNVGSVAETITVTTAAPLVDIQNVNQHRVIAREVIDAIPTAKNWQPMVVLIPGVQIAGISSAQTGQDVGGSAGDRGAFLSIHGSRGGEMPHLLDGLRYNSPNFSGGGNVTIYRVNTGTAQEISIDVAGLSAEAEVGGVYVNIIPREGGNQFQGAFYGSYMNKSLQANNLSSALRARGVLSVPEYNLMYDVNPSVGGPLMRDKLWFYSGVRWEGVKEHNVSAFYAKDPLAYVYVPDLNRPAITDVHFSSVNTRLTWQASPKNRFGAFFDRQGGCNCPYSLSPTRPPEGAVGLNYEHVYLAQAKWTAPVTNRLLLSSGLSIFNEGSSFLPLKGLQPTYPTTELSTGVVFRYPTFGGFSTERLRAYNGRADITYVTGSHNLKFGANWKWGHSKNYFRWDNTELILLNGIPSAVTVRTNPYDTDQRVKASGGLYGQDQWTIRRVTLNLGVRFDFTNAYVPAHYIPPVAFVGARDFAAVYNVPNWKDIVPRLGVAWDVFGDGKTAVKLSLSQYMASMMTGLANLVDPVVTTVNATTRPWTDLNGDFIPQENELGPLANPNFGKTVVSTTYDRKNFLEGWGKRPYSWETSVGIEHQVLSSLSVNAAYFRRAYGNFVVKDNVSVAPTDYDPYCVTTPVDSRLPGGGGQRLCGFYDINTTARARSPNNLVTSASHYGDIHEVYNGADLVANFRLSRGTLVQGGLNVGRIMWDNCEVVGKVENVAGPRPFNHVINYDRNPSMLASPSSLYCHVAPPFQTQIKLLASYQLPWWGLQTSATFQSLPGPEVTASYAATNAEIAPSLGRDLSGGAKTATVELIAPGTVYGDRLYQIDWRLAKTLRLGSARVQGVLDLYNMLNAAPVLSQNNTLGPLWLTPTAILPGRLVKFGVSLDF